MNDTREQFLKNIHINTNNYPATFYERIKSIPLSIVEKSYCAVSEYCGGRAENFHIRDLVGTDHPRYAGKTWIEAFLDLDRGSNIIELYNNNPNYYDQLRDPNQTDLGLIKIDGKYYIFGHAGGGNNRLITMKNKYLGF